MTAVFTQKTSTTTGTLIAMAKYFFHGKNQKHHPLLNSSKTNLICLYLSNKHLGLTDVTLNHNFNVKKKIFKKKSKVTFFTVYRWVGSQTDIHKSPEL